MWIDEYTGRGVVTTRPFSKGDFLFEYRGELVTAAEGRNREGIRQRLEGATMSYVMYTDYKGANWW